METLVPQTIFKDAEFKLMEGYNLFFKNSIIPFLDDLFKDLKLEYSRLKKGLTHYDLRFKKKITYKNNNIIWALSRWCH